MPAIKNPAADDVAQQLLTDILAWLSSPDFRARLDALQREEGEVCIADIAARLGMPVKSLSFWIARDHVANTGKASIVRDENDQPFAYLSLAQVARH